MTNELTNLVWWHVYPLGFCGAPIRDWYDFSSPTTAGAGTGVDACVVTDAELDSQAGQRRLRRLINWLDYARDVGFGGLILGPIFASATHGYDTLDQFQVDPRLGDEGDFFALVAACRERGLKLVLDGVFSHVGEQHPWLRHDIVAGSEGGDLFDIEWEAAGGPRPRVWEGHGQLVRFNHQSAAARDYAVRVMEHWLERGIDGWRLDAAYSVPTDFWAEVIGRVRKRFPDAWFLAEMIHGDYAEFQAESLVDTVTQYELWKSVWSSIKDQNFFELDWTLQRHNALLEHFVPQTFIGNHDVTRIASTLGEPGALVAAVVLFTVAGTPSVYAGDELGMLGVKTDGWSGDDDVRPEFPDRPDHPAVAGGSVLDAYRRLIALRAERPWLVTATTSSVSLENTRYTYRVTSATNPGDWLEVELNLSSPQPAATICDTQGNRLITL